MLTGLDWVGIGFNGEHHDAPFVSIKMEFSEKQSNCQLLMKDSVPCSYFIRDNATGVTVQDWTVFQLICFI
jgi:hypothetical protein